MIMLFKIPSDTWNQTLEYVLASAICKKKVIVGLDNGTHLSIVRITASLFGVPSSTGHAGNIVLNSCQKNDRLTNFRVKA
jgi:hypothetical protein